MDIEALKKEVKHCFHSNGYLLTPDGYTQAVDNLKNKVLKIIQDYESARRASLPTEEGALQLAVDLHECGINEELAKRDWKILREKYPDDENKWEEMYWYGEYERLESNMLLICPTRPKQTEKEVTPTGWCECNDAFQCTGKKGCQQSQS